MKVSIVTVVYNNAATIAHAIESTLSQDHSDIEYIVVDGASTDGTTEIIKKYEHRISRFICEKDKGLYDAMNKGMKMATGDIIGILNSDDFFNNSSVISGIVKAFEEYNIDASIADIVFIDGQNQDNVIRHYSGKRWRPSHFAWGYMPAHPSFFCRKWAYEKYGYFKTDYRIAADYEILIRFLQVNRVPFRYLPMVTTRMRLGGASTRNIASIITLNREIRRACRENGVYTNYLMIYSKYFFKPFEFLFKTNSLHA